MQCYDQTAQMNYHEIHAEIFNMSIYSFNPIVLRVQNLPLSTKLYTILGFLSATELSVFAPKSVIAS